MTSPDSSGSEQPPWSTDYPLTAERLAMPPPRDVQPKSYDVIELSAEFDGVDDEAQMENDAFLKSDHGYEEGWIGSKLLGVGSAGRAGLWVKLDRNGEVTDVSAPLNCRQSYFRYLTTV